MPDDLAIAAEGLTKHFGDVQALDDVSFEAPRGSVLGLLGPNGAGKTTAVRILTTILLPDAGTARVLGHDVVRDPDAVRVTIGLAGQYAAVDENLTARENLRMVGRLTHLSPSTIRQRTDELLERFALNDAADRPVRTYSGGMRRRLDLAAALVHRPPVLFLDEPTTGLDPQGRNDLWEVIAELVREGASLLLTTQYLEEADRLADRIAVVDHGNVIANGTPAELKASLGTTVLELRMHDDEDAGRACEVLAASSPTREGATLGLKVDEGSRTVIEALNALDGAGLEPASLALREPSLDDVFLSLTGHRALTDADAHADDGDEAAVATAGGGGSR